MAFEIDRRIALPSLILTSDRDRFIPYFTFENKTLRRYQSFRYRMHTTIGGRNHPWPDSAGEGRLCGDTHFAPHPPPLPPPVGKGSRYSPSPRRGRGGRG